MLLWINDIFDLGYFFYYSVLKKLSTCCMCQTCRTSLVGTHGMHFTPMSLRAQGVIEGFQGFEKGGVSPRFVIIDDGWQLITKDYVGITCLSDTQQSIRDRTSQSPHQHAFIRNMLPTSEHKLKSNVC